MTIRLLTALLLLVSFSSAHAQKNAVHWPARPLSAAPALRTTQTAQAPDTLRILALMVDFLTDTDGRTTGTGRFQTDPVPYRMIDPPPHDAGYFADKITFVRNYFAKVSGGKLEIVGDVLPTVVTLPQTMSFYAPAAFGNDDRRLAQLALDSWTTADSVFAGTTFSDYDTFVLFHAGVGHDIDFVSIFGFDPAPFDIPSLTFGIDGFRNVLDDPSFTGIPVNGGTFFIDNTIILPETESRVIPGGTGNDTLQLAMNGLFAASIGSRLGLPDLFDTRTGRSAIGQFGLMDGAGIFAFYGLFPPEPGAWEKIFLGWVDPIVAAHAGTLTLPAVGLTEPDSIYKIPVSETEYFLVENRSRDPLGNGQTLTLRQDGAVRSLHIQQDSSGFFNYANVRGIHGSLLDVEDFDWAVIGIHGDHPSFEGGGVLIWHIDESVIAAGMANNSVNADPQSRGVDLEEADGSQDIGQVYDFFSAGSGSEAGSPLDCWFAGNIAVMYKNTFNDASFPNSRSNTGARSLVTLKNFSPRSPRMTVDLEWGDALAIPLPGFPKVLDGTYSSPRSVDLTGDNIPEILMTRTLESGPKGRGGLPTGQGALVAFRQSGQPLFFGGDPSGMVAQVDSPRIGNVAVLRHPGLAMTFLASASSPIHLWSATDNDSSKTLDLVRRVSFAAERVMFVDTFLVAVSADSVMAFTLGGATTVSFSAPGAKVAGMAGTARFVAGWGDSVAAYDLVAGTRAWAVRLSGAVSAMAGTNGNAGSVARIACLVNLPGGSQEIRVLDQGGMFVGQPVGLARYLSSGESVIPQLIWSDVDGEGTNDILFVTSGGRVVALNATGLLLDGFPVKAAETVNASTRFVVGHVSGQGRMDVILTDGSGTLSVVPLGVAQPDRMMLQSGSLSLTSPALFPFSGTSGTTVGYASVDTAGRLTALDLRTAYDAGRMGWPMEGFDATGSAASTLTTASPVPLASSFFPRDRVYNWPNPVYGATTNIRFFVTDPASVSVKIFDLAGHLITELNGTAPGGSDGEIPWDVRNIQSGVYLARVEVTGGGRSDMAVIKIAVVK